MRPFFSSASVCAGSDASVSGRMVFAITLGRNGGRRTNKKGFAPRKNPGVLDVTVPHDLLSGKSRYTGMGSDSDSISVCKGVDYE